MNNQVSSWIIQFLLRQRVNENILYGVLSVLPLDNDDSQLKKGLLVRAIEIEVSKAAVSEKILEYLELIGELDRIEGKVVLEAMRDAYCAVAVDCTVRFLGLRSDEKYLESLMRVWRGRIRKMEESGDCRLMSGKLRNWREDLEAACSDVQVRDRILTRNTRTEAVRAVKMYVKVYWDEVGPSFVEENFQDVLKTGANHGADEHREDQPGGEGLEDVIIVDCDEAGCSHIPSNENHQTQGLPGPHAGVSSGLSKDMRYISSEVEWANTSLRDCFTDLHTGVTDPLPEALKIAEAVVANRNIESGFGEDNCAAMAEASTTRDLNPDSSDDPLAFSEELPNRPALSSPKRSRISPLKIYNMKKFTKRRRVKRWSTLEEDTLKNGVEKFGRGAWKTILDEYRDIFQERTDVDLKDKWRNMTKFS